MKKTYTINLSGKIFHIDEDALKNYKNTSIPSKHITREKKTGTRSWMTSKIVSGNFSRKA